MTRKSLSPRQPTTPRGGRQYFSGKKFSPVEQGGWVFLENLLRGINCLACVIEGVRKIASPHRRETDYIYMVDEGGGGEAVQTTVIITIAQRTKGRQALPCTMSLAMLATPRPACTACLATKPAAIDWQSTTSQSINQPTS
ncbi:MAG: hypothetical protein [Caudoviricetes sp.]|nr:MAG: hypothetical protein [Caudoviricetes sp.]